MNRIIKRALFFLIAALPAFGQPQGYGIVTVAGGVNPYYYPGTGDGGLANSAALGNPVYDVTVDGAGNLYILAGRLIRKVTLAGTISTYAGGGAELGEFVQATQAQFAPLAIVADSPGNLYIADTAFGISRIRKVDTKGIVTTVAGGALCCNLGDGGPATSAYLSLPYGLALDGSGNIYIAQVNGQNNLIRMVSASGTITTVAGGGQSVADFVQATSASLSRPTGVAVDAAGNIYIAEANGNRIREVSGGIILTIAGTGAASNSGDGGSATQAGIDSPWHLGVDAAGDVFITQLKDGLIRMVTPGGTISTIAGNGAGLDSPAGIALGACGQIYVAQASATIGSVSVLTPASATPSASCPSIQINYSISGQISSSGRALAGVKIALSGSSNASTQTDVNGNYLFSNLASGGSFTVTPALAGYTFQPASLSFANLIANQTAGNFTAIPTSLTASPATLSFAVAQGSAAPPTQSVSISSNDGTAVPFAVSALSAGNWLSVSTKSGASPQSFSVSVSPGALTMSSTPYTGIISVTPTGPLASIVQALSISVSLSVTSSTPSQLGVTPASLSFSGSPGGAAQTGQLQISSSGGVALPFTISTAGGSWLTASPSTGSTPGSVSVSANLAGLAAGSYMGMVSISAQGTANSPVNVPVTLTVTPPLGPAPTTTTLTSSSNAPSTGQSMTLTAAVTPSTATGSVTFNDGSSVLGASPLSGGTSSLVWTPISAGAHPLTAMYGGDTNDAPSTSAALTENVAESQTPVLDATPSTVSLVYVQGSPSPIQQTVGVSSNTPQLSFSVTATTSSGGPWPFSGVGNGTVPSLFNILVIPGGLLPGSYAGTLTISSPNAPSVMVNVSLTVIASAPLLPPELDVIAPPLVLSGQQGGATVSAELQVANVGGGVLSFTATATSISGKGISGNGWLSVSPASGSIDNSAGAGSSPPTPLTVTCDPSAVPAGTYLGSITVTGAGTTTPPIPVTCSVAAPTPVILVSQAGLNFTAASQGGAPLPQQIGILNVGSGTLDFTAQASTLSGGPWLLLSSAGGMVQRPYLDVSPVSVTIDPNVLGTLTPGDYYGQIQIADAAVPAVAVNSPQLVTVILSVLPAGTDPGPEISPSSLIFTGLPGASPGPQSIAIGIRKAVPDQYSAISQDLNASLATVNGFTYSPATSAVLPNQPVNLQVTPEFTALNPGEIDRGTILLQFSDGTPRTISVLTVVAPSATGDSRLAPQSSGSCTNLNVEWRTPAPPNFSVVQAQSQTLELQVADDCGNLIANPMTSAVQATFSNKDNALNLVHIGNGVWTGTWKPVKPSSAPVTVLVTAFNSVGTTLQSGQSSALFGTVLPGNTPLVTAGGVQQAASYVQGAPIAPGTLITLQGSNLADAQSLTAGPPLPTIWNGAQVFLGTEALPLLYTATGQVNVQVPYDVPVNTRFQVTVQRDNLESLPEQLVIAEAQPGIFTVDSSGAGQGVIYRSDGVTLAQPGTPAVAGETITIYCTGLGTVTPAVAAGTPPPVSPPSYTVNPVSVTIGGLDGQASYGTLAPGQPGVYLVTATVPAGVSSSADPVVVTVAGQSSPAVVTMAVQ